tara:strand:+ start:103 stop:870 length:768 start_codon:yes stop_codon:yes gene_type:complete
MIPTYLSEKNAHNRDSHIIFDEGPHIYTIDGDSSFTSVTTWNHSHFEKFNSDKIIENMMKGKNWKKNKYYGMTPQQIKDLWAENGRKAAEAGTKMHYDIECFYNNMTVNNKSIEYDYFLRFHKQHNSLEPYRTEWMIYDKELKLAGSIDMVFKNEDGSISIYDWKRCKDIKKDNPWQSAKTECISHLPDSNYWHYSLQLNTYKAILESKYDIKVRDLYLVCLHPDNKSNTYEKIKVPILKKEIKSLFNLRKSQLK